MAIRSGIAAQVGIAPESTYGTYAAPTKFLVADSYPFKKAKSTVQGTGLVGGQMLPLGARRVDTLTSASGSIGMDIPTTGFGLLLQALMGTSVTPVQQASSTAYLQTHTLADPFGKSLSVQVGVPELTGTVRPYTYLGGKVTGAEFTYELDKSLVASFDVDCQAVVESQPLVAASYVTSARQFVGTDVAVKIGTYGSEVAVSGVSKMSVKFDRKQATDRNYFGAAGLKAEPVLNAMDDGIITGTLTADYLDKTIFADRWAGASTGFSLVLEAKGPLISGTYYSIFRITLPQVFLTGDTPTVDGPDIVSGDFPFAVTFDGTNLPKIEYISTDVTL